MLIQNVHKIEGVKSMAEPYTETYSAQVLKKAPTRTNAANVYGQFGNFGIQRFPQEQSLKHIHIITVNKYTSY